MGRIFFGILFTFIVFFASEADAKRGAVGYGWAEDLVFVETAQSGGGRSLCILARQHVIFDVVNLWRKAESYAVASNRCDAESYSALSEVGFSAEQANGVFSTDLPARPRLSFVQMLEGAWGSAAFLVLILVLVARRIFARGRTPSDISPMKSTSRNSPAAATAPSAEAELRLAKAQDRVFEVICRAAAARGPVDDDAIEKILAVAERVTARRYPREQALVVLEGCGRPPAGKWFRDLGVGLDERQKAGVVYAAWLQLSSEGEMSGPALDFLGKLAVGFGFGPDRIREIVSTP